MRSVGTRFVGHGPQCHLVAFWLAAHLRQTRVETLKGLFSLYVPLFVFFGGGEM